PFFPSFVKVSSFTFSVKADTFFTTGGTMAATAAVCFTTETFFAAGFAGARREGRRLTGAFVAVISVQETPRSTDRYKPTFVPRNILLGLTLSCKTEYGLI